MRTIKKTVKIGEINVSEFSHIDPRDLAIICLLNSDRFEWLEDQYLAGRGDLMDTEEMAARIADEANSLLGLA